MRYSIKNEEVQKIINFYGFGETAAGQSFSYREGDPWAYLEKDEIDGKIWSIKVSDKALKTPCKVKEWTILHECGHIQCEHSLHSGRANPKHELEADLWACCIQKTIQHYKKALEFMSDSNLGSLRMSIKWNTSRGNQYFIPFTYKYCLDEIMKMWKGRA